MNIPKNNKEEKWILQNKWGKINKKDEWYAVFHGSALEKDKK